MTQLETNQAREDELHRAMAAFEACAATPVVPAQQEGWLAAIRSAYEALRPRFEQQTRRVHSAEFVQIADEDPGLVPRVEEMRTEDRAILNEAAELERNLADLSSGGDAAVGELAERAMAFIARLRKQEVAVRTWLMEAYTRDRGVAD